MKLNRRSLTQTRINSLLIDGESLLKQGFHGAKQIQMKNGSVGAIFHFINTIKRFYQDYGITKVVVFWEGEDSKKYRQGYYPYYKTNRNDKVDLNQEYDLERQRVRIKQYLEELYIRQVEVYGCEADDGIAYYVKNSPNENKIIYTNDRDLLQLLSTDVRVFLHGKKIMITEDNFTNYFSYHHKNVGLIKILSGDIADNISGLKGIGEDTVIKLFPELKNEEKNCEWVIERVNDMLLESPNSKKLLTIKNGETKWGTYGIDYFSVMNKVINLDTPNVTDELKTAISEMVTQPLSPEGRGGVNKIMEMMKVDELLNFLPKYDDNFFVFWGSFITIINKEKKIYEQYKK